MCSVGAWGQDATFDMGVYDASGNDGTYKWTFSGGSIDDVKDGYTNLTSSATLTIGPADVKTVSMRYVKIFFQDNVQHTLKWKGLQFNGEFPENYTSETGTGSVTLRSNYGTGKVEIATDETLPIKKVVIYSFQSYGNDTPASITTTISDFKCNNNSISLDKLTAVGKYASFSPSTKKAILLNGTGDNYIGFKFGSPVNLKDLSSFVIEGENASNVINSVTFVCTGGNFDKFNSPTNITSFDDGQKKKLESVSEIRILTGTTSAGVNKEGSFSINSIKLNFGGIHAETTPTLQDGTTNDMEITVGDALTLKASNGYWREYTDDSYTSVKNYAAGSPIPDDRWNSTCPLDGTTCAKLTEGVHYFGIMDAATCEAFGVPHSSELVKVKVTVKSDKKIHDKPTCGGFYFRLDKAEKSADLKNFAFSYADGITATGGGYVSFFFEEGLNFSEVDSWTVHLTQGEREDIAYVGFYDANGNKVHSNSQFYTNAASRTLESQHKTDLKNVKEIRIGITTDKTVKFDYFYMNIKHDLGKLPTLDEQYTRPSMIVKQNQNLRLKITDWHGYWRQYTDNTCSTEKLDQWIKSGNDPDLPIEMTETGVYYFGVHDEDDCAIGNHHKSDIVKVQVTVIPANAEAIFTDESEGAGVFNQYSKEYTDGQAYGDLSYTKTVTAHPAGEEPEDVDVTVTFNNIRYDSRDSEPECNGVKLLRDKLSSELASGNEVRVIPPVGYRVKNATFYFGETSKYNVSFNGGESVPAGTASSVSFTNNGTKDYVRLVVRGEANDDEKELHIKYVTFVLEEIPGAAEIDEDRTLASTYSQHGRNYWLYAPRKVVASKDVKAPLLLSLHGGSGYYKNVAGADASYPEFNGIAKKEGFVVIYPCGGNNPLPHFSVDGGDNLHRNWLATGDDNADMQYLKQIVDEMKHDATLKDKIDFDRVYITGYSNGGMMAYAAANAAADVFAAFASINGYPMNDFHLRHHGVRPVPFIHFQSLGDNSWVPYKYMNTIVDNMIARNGCSYTPSKDEWSGGGDHGYRVRVYSPTVGEGFPYVYYEIGVPGAQNNPGHDKRYANVTGDGKSTEQLMWDFMKQYKLNDACDKNLEFKPELPATSEHGWVVNDGVTLAKYGESGGWSAPAENTPAQNIYHTIHLKAGDHYVKFNAKNTVTTKKVIVRVTKLSNTSVFDAAMNDGFTPNPTLVLEKQYYAMGDICVKFTSDAAAEYMLEIEKANVEDNTTISGISISTAGKEAGSSSEYNKTDFTGYYPFVNRLRAQWNFDLCDGVRFNLAAIPNNSGIWSKEEQGNTIVYTNIVPLRNQELTYDGKHPIPVSAELLFNADAGKVKFFVYKNAAGEVTGTNLVCEPGVQMTVPYMENSCRSDRGDLYPQVVDGVITNKEAFENCMHHMKRDILYVALAGGKHFLWGNGDGGGYIEANAVVDGEISNMQMFYPGGDEEVNGVHWYKCDLMGVPNKPCTFQFRRTTTFDRIAVNRNLTASFYTEYIDKMDGLSAPKPGMRLRVDTKGLRVASDGGTSGYWDGAITMTYGGWPLNDMSYKNQAGAKVDDSWSELDVWDGNTSAYKEIPTPSDGFPVISYMNNVPKSESLQPNSESSIYHPGNNGDFFLGSYIANITPWSLPCRGGYVRFEPTHPGVLNVHVVQEAGAIYYIADEFGKLITSDTKNSMVYTKYSTEGNSITSVDGGYRSTMKDYIKYSFNVYPGKTYYVFSKNAGLGFAGFFFEPYVTRINQTDELAREDVLMADVTFDDNTSYSLPEKCYPNDVEVTKVDIPGVEDVYYTTVYSPKTEDAGSHAKTDENYWAPYTINYSRSAVKARYNRHFTSGQWTSICLPFSMNQYQMEDQFGEGTKVILLRDITAKENTAIRTELTTANFIAHANQDIIAGYPYFIYPTNVRHSDHIEANVSLYASTPSIVSVSGAGVHTWDQNGGSYGGLDVYTFNGNFDANHKVKAGSYVMANNGKLTRITTDANSKPYRAYLEYNGTYTPSHAIKKINYGDLEVEADEETSIEDFLFEQGIIAEKTDVYSVNGTKVRSNVDNFQDLPKGIYIVNGKKYIVK